MRLLRTEVVTSLAGGKKLLRAFSVCALEKQLVIAATSLKARSENNNATLATCHMQTVRRRPNEVAAWAGLGVQPLSNESRKTLTLKSLNLIPKT